jgi:broad specificity phosphatase PhoE
VANRLLYLVRHGEQENPEVESDEAGLSGTGRRQAALLGERLRAIPFAALHHSPVRRAAQTAELIAERLPGVPLRPSEVVGDYVPGAPDPATLPPAYAGFVAGFTEVDLVDGPKLAARAVERFTTPPETDRRELVVTHNFLIGWLVRHALDAPDWRWIGLNHYNCGLTVILFRTGRPASLVSYNDVGHLPPELRGTGLPAELRV